MSRSRVSLGKDDGFASDEERIAYLEVLTDEFFEQSLAATGALAKTQVALRKANERIKELEERDRLRTGATSNERA